MITFTGRVGRGRFALFALVCWLAFQVVALAGSVPTYVLVAPKLHDPVPSQLAAAMPEGVAGVLLIMSLLAMLLVAIVGASGWFAVPVFGNVRERLPTNWKELIWYAVLVSVPGSKGANTYG